MSDFEIDFEWPVAKYEYQSVDEIFRERGHHPDFRTGTPREEVPEDAGYLIRKSKPKSSRPAPKAMEYAVKLLVEREKTPLHKVALTIARTIGGLNARNEAHEHPERERLEDWEELADYLRGIFKGEHDEFLYSDEPNAPPLIGEVGIFLIRGNAGVRLALRPEDLHQALIFYAARMAATGTTFHTCEHCSAPFLGGGAGRGSKKKRSDARFCSDKCRWTHHNKVRMKAR